MHGLHGRIRKLERAADGRAAVRKGTFAISWDRDVIKQIRRYNVRLTTIDRKRYYKSDTGNKLSKSESVIRMSRSSRMTAYPYLTTR